MVRTLILGLLMLAAARGAAADGTAPAPGTPAAAPSAPATAHSVDLLKRGAKKQSWDPLESTCRHASLSIL